MKPVEVIRQGRSLPRRPSAEFADVLEARIQVWTKRRDEAAALSAFANTAQLCDLVLRDLETIRTTAGAELLTLTEAACRSGYTREHLGRLVASGTIPNAGRRNAPRIRAADLPRKVGYLPAQQVDPQIAGASKGQIVRSIVDLPTRSSR
jgi:hypothetical protein